MFYHFKVYKEKNGYWAKCIELDGCRTEGDTMDELRTNMEEALNLYLDEPGESKILFQLPKDNIRGKNIEKVPVKPQLAFAFLMRHMRISNSLTQKKLRHC